MDIKKTIKSHLPHDTLSKKIWIGESMIPEFRGKLLEIASAFIEYLKIPIDIIDITMTGSYANYNYTVFSDIDLHVIVDMQDIPGDVDLVEEFFKAKKYFWNDRHDIELKGIEVELYPQDINEKSVMSGVFSVRNNEWVVKPSKFKNKIDEKSIEKNSKKLLREIELAIKISIKESETVLIDVMLKKLKKMRQSGLEKSGELSTENITYKVIRSKGYLQKLFDTKFDIIDDQLGMP